MWSLRIFSLFFIIYGTNALLTGEIVYRNSTRAIGSVAYVSGIILTTFGVGCLLYSLKAKNTIEKKLFKVHGKNESEVISLLGNHTYSNIITLKAKEEFTGYYKEIHNTYDSNDPESEGVLVKELHWNKKGFKEILFLHKIDGIWEVFDSIRYKESETV